MPDPKTRKQIVRFGIGALAGAGIGYLAGRLGLIDMLEEMPGEDIASTLVAALLLMLGLFAIVATSSPGVYRRLAANYEEGDPLDRHVLRHLRLSGGLLLISALLMLAPPIATRLGAGGSSAIIVASGIGVLMLVQSWLNLKVLRDSDELTRAATMEACVAAAWLFQLGLFGWAALTKLGLAQDVSSWTLMTVAMAVYLLASIGVALRRGLFA